MIFLLISDTEQYKYPLSLVATSLSSPWFIQYPYPDLISSRSYFSVNPNGRGCATASPAPAPTPTS